MKRQFRFQEDPNMLDMKLLAAIQDGTYDAWSKMTQLEVPDPHYKYGLELFTDDPEIRFVKAKKWRRVIAWDLGKLGEPNVMVVLKYLRIETGWGDSYYPGIPRRYCVTTIYQVNGVNESHDDYSVEVAKLQAKIDSGELKDTTLVYDATGVGPGVEEQIRHIQGFETVIPVTFSTGTDMKRNRRFVVTGKSQLVSDLESVVKQRRIRIPDKKSTERLNRQIAGLQVEETIQGYYRRVDDKRDERHNDLLIALGMGISYVEYLSAKISAAGGY